MRQDSVGVFNKNTEPSPFVISCEHASNYVPPDFDIRPFPDEWFFRHWGWDIGAYRIARYIAKQEGAPLVYSKYSRLLCDVNRQPGAEELMRRRVDGKAFELNQNLSRTEKRERMKRFFEPYHRVLSRVIEYSKQLNPAVWFLSIHSFTPRMEGERRQMEFGILFDEYGDLARNMAAILTEKGFQTTLNRPYSGFENSVYSVARHGNSHNIPYLEIEIRNDLIDTPEGVRFIGDQLLSVLEKCYWHGDF